MRAVQEYDEWIKTLPGGKKVRYSYQLLTTGFSASAETLKPVDATMVYTHTHTDHLLPPDRAQVEAEFTEDLSMRPEHVAVPGRVKEAGDLDPRFNR